MLNKKSVISSNVAIHALSSLSIPSGLLLRVIYVKLCQNTHRNDLFKNIHLILYN